MKSNSSYFAEVIESSLEHWVIQSWKWDQFPTFGSVVVIETDNKKLFGIVHQIQTGSMDPTRYPFAYQKTEQELLEEQPQIFEFLKTNFHCLIMGYQEGEKIFYMIAPQPPKIHSFVRSATTEEISIFLNNPQYLHLLFAQSNKIFNLDELLLALLKLLSENQILTSEYFEKFSEIFSLFTNNDYRRLKLFLQRTDFL
jgi:hypothetical protein